MAWRLEAGELTVEVTLPEGVTGLLDLDGQAPVELGGGTSQHCAR